MKLLTFTIMLSIYFTSAFAETSCSLSRTGVQKTTIFKDYSTVITDDLSDPSCRTPMGRLCSQIETSKSVLQFPLDVKVVHKVIKTKAPYGTKKRQSQFIIYRDFEWFATFDGHYVSAAGDQHSQSYEYYVPPKFSIQLGIIMEGGYTLECRELI